MEAQLVHTSPINSAQAITPSQEENLISNGRFVELIGEVCEENNVSIKQYEPQLLDREGEYKLYTASLILSGKYTDLIRTLKYQEGNIQSIKISTLKFEYDEKKMKDKKLEMIAIIKQVEKY